MTLGDLTASAYHADQVSDVPTLSASIAKLLCSASPAHAFAAHPKLNPDFERVDDQKFDLGTVVHALLLEGVDAAHIVHANDWRTAEARQQRDDARAAGRIPLLAKDWDRVRLMVAAAHAQLDRFDITPPPFTRGEAEVALTWEMQGVQCRALIDWLHTGGVAVSDYKSTSASAHPAAWAKTAVGMGAEVQVAFHSMGVEAVYGVQPVWRYVVQETYPPFALSVIEPGPDMVELGRAKVEHALGVWRDCLASGDWPGYGSRVATIEAPGWALAQWMEREAMQDAA